MVARRKSERTIPISLRLTEAELSRLKAEASGKSVSSHIRRGLFGADARTRAIRVPAHSDAHIARLLAQLGQSGIASSLRDLAEAVRIGALPVTPETEFAIRNACDAIDRMRDDLVHALGLRKGSLQ